MAVSLVVYIAVYLALGAASVMKFTNVTIISVLLFIILPIFQAFAEEYVFRGFVMQAFGSWFKIPIVAIILQAILFGIIHVQYNIMGMICILTSGIIYGFVTWYTKELEVSSALHAVNNFTAFIGTLLAVASTSGNMSGMGTFIQN